MAVIDEATNALRELEAQLVQPAKGRIDSVLLAERIRAVRKQLSTQEVR